MEFLMDPSIWVGLATLVVLEIVLGIDNLVFIAILADKLPPKQRDKARLIGLSMRGWKTASIMTATAKATPASGSWWRRLWCWTPSSRWMP